MFVKGILTKRQFLQNFQGLMCRWTRNGIMIELVLILLQLGVATTGHHDLAIGFTESHLELYGE